MPILQLAGKKYKQNKVC